MKPLWQICFWLCLVVAMCFGQEKKKPATLLDVTEMWSHRSFETSEVLNLIDNDGSDIDLDETAMTTLLQAAKDGDRSPKEIAAVVLRLFSECIPCRSRMWFKMGKEDILATLRRRTPAFTLDEIKLRGTRELPHSTDFTDELRRAGASDELISAIDDIVRIPIPEGYGFLPIQKAPDLDPKANEGRLHLHFEIDQQTEFVFRHSSLFYKPAISTPKDLGSSFNRLGPAVAKEHVKWELEQIQPKAGKKSGSFFGRKKIKDPRVETDFVTDPSGRNGFRIVISDVDPGKHEIDLVIHWTIQK